MTESKSKPKKLRQRAAVRGILSIAELARLVPCSRTSIYLSLENPRRFPTVTRRIHELTTTTT